jgi:hypothetical protein
VHNNQALVGSLFVYRLLIRYFGPYVIYFVKLCVFVTVAKVMLFRDFGPCEIFLNVFLQPLP